MSRPLRICHFGPETPALSQTFVYKEILALRRRGHVVIPATVRRPENPASDIEQELGPVFSLYDEPKGTIFKAYLSGLARPASFLKALGRFSVDAAKALSVGKLPTALAWHYVCSFRLAAFLRQNEIDHLHIHFAHFPTQIGMYAAALANIPFTVMAHANDIFENALLLKEKGGACSEIFRDDFELQH